MAQTLLEHPDSSEGGSDQITRSSDFLKFGKPWTSLRGHPHRLQGAHVGLVSLHVSRTELILFNRERPLFRLLS